MATIALKAVAKAYIDRVSAQHYHVCSCEGFTRLYYGADAEKRAWRDAKLIAFEGRAPAPLWTRADLTVCNTGV